ncbi:MAG: HEAT repeat domain-containing protein [Actinomycetota bacterium]
MTPEALFALGWNRFVLDPSDEALAALLRAAEPFPGAVVELAKGAVTSERVPERVAGVLLLGHLLPEDVAWEDLWEDPEPSVRDAILHGVGDVVIPAVVVAAASDPVPELRARSCRLLPAVPGGVSLLVDRLDDPVATVVESAIDALLICDPAEVLGMVLDREPSRTRLVLLERMSEVSPGAVLDACSGLPAEVRSHLLSQVIGREMRAELARRLRLHRATDRLAALRTLGEVGAEGVGDAVTAALRDPSPEVREVAAHVVAAQRLTSALDELKRTFATDPDLRVAGAAGDALRTLLSAEGEGSTMGPDVPKEDI